MEPIRLNKYLSEAGFCSRREADRLIGEGEISVNGHTAVVGEKVDGSEEILCGGKPVNDKENGRLPKPVLLLVNKPRGVVCTMSDKDRAPTIAEMIDYPERVYPVGRLDKDSEGLVLMTNQGELANEIMHAANLHEKEYLVTLSKPYDVTFLKRMREGVYLTELGVRTRRCVVEPVNDKTFRIILTQGLNRQIRRMCGALGYVVTDLCRTRIMNLRLGHLNTGDFRKASARELEELSRELEASDKDGE